MAGGMGIGVDLGGTKIASVLLDRDGRVQASDERPTPAATEAILAELVASVEALRRPEVEAVGIGAAGMIDFEAGVMRFAPNLPLRDVPLREHLAEATGLRCLVDNDANAAGWAEYRFGAARGRAHVLLVTVGTGIGGAIIAGGRIYRGAHGFAAEIGHIVVEPGGPPCGCGNRGCWEQMASGRALDRLAAEEAILHPAGAVARAANGGRATGVHLAEAVRASDERAAAIFAEVGRRLGEGLAGLANVLDPEIVVVGGGVAEEGDALLGPARDVFWETVELRRGRPDIPIVPAQLGNDAGAIGAGALALEEAP